jgi:hypothetical protein
VVSANHRQRSLMASVELVKVLVVEVTDAQTRRVLA